MKTEKSDRITLFLIFGFGFVFLICLIQMAGLQSFWVDELYQVDFIRNENSFKDTFKIYEQMIDLAPPLFGLSAYWWYRMVPHTETFLRLLPAIATVAGLILTSLTGRKLKGNRCGLLCMVFGMASSTLIRNVGLEFRHYGFLFLAVALTIYFYVLRFEHQGKENWKSIVLYGVVMALIPYAHYVAVLICVGLFIGDVVLICYKKITVKCICSYIIGAALFLPWMILVVSHTEFSRMTTNGVETASLSHLPTIFSYLTSNNDYLYLLLILAMIVIIIKSIAKIQKKTFTVEEDYFFLLFVGILFFTLGGMYLYSRFFMKNGSVFIIRYTLELLPVIFLLLGYITNMICDYLSKLLEQKYKSYIGCVAVTFVVIILGGQELTIADSALRAYREPYKAVAEVLMKQEDLADEGTALILHYDPNYLNGWKEMYWTDYEQVDQLNFLKDCDEDTYENVVKKKYKKIYTMTTKLHDAFDNDELMNYISENYEIVNTYCADTVTEWSIKEKAE